MNIIDIIFVAIVTPMLIMWAWDEWKFSREWKRWKEKVDGFCKKEERNQ